MVQKLNNYFTYILLYIALNLFSQNNTVSKSNDPSYNDNKFEEENKNIENKEKFVLNETKVKREFNQKFKDSYANEAFVYEQKPKEKNAWDRFKQWLNNWLKSIFDSSGKSNTNYSNWVIYIFSILLILIVIYFIVKALLEKNGAWIFGTNSNKQITDFVDIEKICNRLILKN